MWVSKLKTSGKELDSLRNCAAVLKSFDGSTCRHTELTSRIWYTKLTPNGIYRSKHKRLGAGKYSNMYHCWLSEHGLLYRNALTIRFTIVGIMGTATVWQEMDEPRTLADRHRCAYRQRLEFGPFTNRMAEKCVHHAALYSRIFCAISHWHNPVKRIQFVKACSTHERDETWVEVLDGNPKEKRLIEWPKLRWDDKIKMDLQENNWENLD
jgi:hypothetical protein